MPRVGADGVDLADIDVDTSVNGEQRQSSNTHNLIFSIVELIVYLSKGMTLHAGDVIATGTPPGVAFGMKPAPVYLKAGDLVELGIDGLGTQKQKIVPFKP